ncbi:MAG: hypothetical protein KKC75_08450 [Nanoarchaeota archaeon]|nr:hypothetical protein [Nanoarchaeota archaeon]MBU1005389.1 hypothetical protein [Nanoarchaeota archaeon]MBU1945671.1 hypothetical protein [Nanoarchaeota archaeon]
MRCLIDFNQFKKYLKNITIDTEDTAVVIIEKPNYRATILMESRLDYRERITVEFSIKFEYKRQHKEKIFQREFKIEHHPEDKSTHTRPHVQIYGHGPVKKDKVGELWITLPIEKEEDYVKCIGGFLNILQDMITLCEEGLENDMLNISLLKELEKQKEFLLIKINESLKNELIEFKDPEGKKLIVNPKKLLRLLDQDRILLPLFPDVN